MARKDTRRFKFLFNVITFILNYGSSTNNVVSPHNLLSCPPDQKNVQFTEQERYVSIIKFIAVEGV